MSVKPYKSIFGFDKRSSFQEKKGNSVIQQLLKARAIITEAKKKAKEEEGDLGLQPVTEPSAIRNAIEQVNKIITRLIAELGSGSPALDVLIDASRELEDLETEALEDESEEEESEGEEEGEEELNLGEEDDEEDEGDDEESDSDEDEEESNKKTKLQDAEEGEKENGDEEENSEEEND